MHRSGLTRVPVLRISNVKDVSAHVSDGVQVGGYFAMNMMMPTMLGWVLGGNTSALRGADRAPHCRVGDKPKAFHEQVPPCVPRSFLRMRYRCMTTSVYLTSDISLLYSPMEDWQT